MSLNTVLARLQGQDAAAIEMIRALRNDRAHGERAMYEETHRLVEQFTQLSAEEQRQVFRRAIAIRIACDEGDLVDGAAGKAHLTHTWWFARVPNNG